MAKCDVWMPLYIGDYLSNTSRLTTEQHGAYLLLIMDYWVNGRLPDDDAALANITKLAPERWLATRPIIIKYFHTENGELIQNRIESEKGKAEYLSKIRSVAGSKGGSKTQANNQANAQANEQHGSTPSPSPSPSPSQLPSPPPSEKEKALFVLPEWIDSALWTEWMSVRKKLKAVNSPRAMELLVDKLFTISQSGISVNTAIKTAIEKSWKSIELDWLSNQKKGKKDVYAQFLEGTKNEVI